jgi:ElaB/YqjD/DUF883 family membrane-anchored ribosome-binding protein
MAKAKEGPVEQVTRKLGEMEEGVEDNIREHPVQSVLVAFGVGLLAGAVVAHLLKRR